MKAASPELEMSEAKQGAEVVVEATVAASEAAAKATEAQEGAAAPEGRACIRTS